MSHYNSPGSSHENPSFLLKMNSVTFQGAKVKKIHFDETPKVFILIEIIFIFYLRQTIFEQSLHKWYFFQGKLLQLHYCYIFIFNLVERET